MTEYWVEENIRPTDPKNADETLLVHLKPLIDHLKTQDMITWHFLREGGDGGWRGDPNAKIIHIRLRVRAKDEAQRKEFSDYLTKELDILKKKGNIIDHYLGNHGKPMETYAGENANFDEERTDSQRKGWDIAQKHFEAGSEIALLLIEAKLHNLKMGKRFNLDDLLHFTANQCGRPEVHCQINGTPFKCIALN